MMARNAGPAGSGLLPPGIGDPGVEDEDEGQDGRESDEVDLDGVPPVDREEDDDHEEDDDDPEGGESDDTDALVAAIEAKFQKKFDRAISRMHRNLEQKYNKAPKLEDDDDEEDEEEEPPVKKRKKAPVSRGRDDRSSVTSIRLLAREVISEEMEDAGKQERSAVRAVIDEVLPYVDWSQVDDQDEFVEGLVTRLKGVSADLVKTGSDRKVAQLRKAGILQERPGQPGAAPQSRARTQVGKKLAQGASAAERRFPGGTRSLHSRSR